MPRLHLAPGLQRRKEVLACDATIVWDSPPGVAAIQRLRAGPRTPSGAPRDALRVLADLGQVAGTARRRLSGRSSAPRGATPSLLVLAEQAPSPDSKVTLSHRSDPLGQPQLEVDWRVGDLERHTMKVMAETVASEFDRLGLGVVEPAAWLRDSDEWTSRIYDTYHPMGSTRMAPSAADGVVDSDCRIHGTDNLFVAGASIFPSAGAANPTLGIVTLAIRLADHLKAAACLS